MAEEEELRPDSVVKNLTLGSVLRGAGKRFAKVAEGIGPEIVANYQDMKEHALDSGRYNPMSPFFAMSQISKTLRDREMAKHQERYGDQATIGPAPYAMHSSDPGVKIGGMALDPMNLAGVGIVAKTAKKVADVAEKVLPEVPKAIQRMGASKEARELSAARRAAEAAEMEKPVREVARTAEERAAVAPDKYRQMYQAEGEQAVVDAARRGEHIREAPSGSGFTGFPRDVKTKRDINRLRGSLDKQLADAQEAVTYAEVPERTGNWYPRARAGIVETTEPWMIPRTIENIATHSAGVAPVNETSFALRHGQSRALGAPQRGFRGAQQSELDEAVEQGRPASLRFKIGEYRNKHDPTREQASPFGTNDFRSAQEFSYTTPKGEPWKVGVTDVMHPVMDAERALVVDRARKRGATMTGEMAQEFPWVLGKGEDLFLQGKFAGKSDLESKVNALREANKTSADYYPKHAMSMTYEKTPGELTGHRPDIAQKSFAEQREYGPQWTRPPTETDPHARDAIYSATGMRQLPPVEGAGSWAGTNQPLTIARPLAFPDVETVMGLSPTQVDSFKAAEMFRALVGGQSATAGNLPVTLASRGGKTGVLAERMGMNKVGNPESRLPSVEEMRALENVAGKHSYDVTATGRGALLMPRTGENVAPPAKLLRDLRNKGGFAEIEAALQGSTATPAGIESFYMPVMPPERHAGKGVATARTLRQMAKAPEKVAQDLGESDEIRRVITGAHAEDALAGAQGEKVLDALQKSRRFLAEEDWPRVVDLVRKGMKVPAAMAALGYSLSGMAADDKPGAPR